MPTTRISARVSAISESATLAVDAKAKALKAAGRPVIGFGAGEPDFPTPDYIVEAARQATAEPRFHKYTPAAGLPELRKAIAEKTARDSGYAVTADQVLVTNGGKQAVYQTFATLLDEGDEALLPAPYWTTYPEAIALAGGKSVIVPTDETTGYLASVEDLDAACTERTKLLVFVSPSNPTGAVYSPGQVRAIGEWAAAKGIWVVTDEIYEHLVYGDATFSSIPVQAPEIADRCVVLNGVAKTYAMTGWRVGWMIGPKDVIKAATNLQSHVTSNVANVSQAAALAAVSGDLSAVEAMREAFDRRQEDDRPDAQRDPRDHLPGAARRVLRLSRASRACSARRSPGSGRRRRLNWPASSWTRPKLPWFPARRSGRPATSGCRTRSGTRISKRALPASASCSLTLAKEVRAPPPRVIGQ